MDLSPLANLATPVAVSSLAWLASLIGGPAGRWPRLRQALAWFALGWLLLWSMPQANFVLRAEIERAVPAAEARLLEPAPFIVVLTDPVELRDDDTQRAVDLGLAGRAHLHRNWPSLWLAAELYREGRGLQLYLSSAEPDAPLDPPRARVLAAVLARLGVPGESLLIEDSVAVGAPHLEPMVRELHKRTREPVILVADALAMPHLMSRLRDLGQRVAPAPAGHVAIEPPRSGSAWLPSLATLADSQRLWRELGRNLAAGDMN